MCKSHCNYSAKTRRRWNFLKHGAICISLLRRFCWPHDCLLLFFYPCFYPRLSCVFCTRIECFAACLFLMMPACNLITKLTNADGTRNTAVKRRRLYRLQVAYSLGGWLDSRVVSVLDSGAEGLGFKSQSRRCRVTVLGKLLTSIVPLFTKQQNW